MLIFSVLLGWGIASIQLFPGFELVSNSIRKIDPSVFLTNASYLPLANLLTSIIPDYFGNPATQNYFGRAYYDNFNYFTGTATIILLFYFMINLKSFGKNRYWLFVLIFSLLLSIKSPIAFILEKIFFLSGGVAARALFLTDFSLSIISAYSINYIFSDNKKDYRKIFLAILLVGFMFSLGFLNKQLMVIDINKQVTLRNMAIPFFCFLISSLILLLSIKRGKYNKILNFILLLVISFQLLYSARKYLPFSSKHIVFPVTPVLEKLGELKSKENRPVRVEINDVIPQNFLMPFGIDTASGYDTLMPLATGQFFSILRKNYIDEKIARVQWGSFYDSNYYPLLNAKYLLAKKIVRDGVFGPEGKISERFANNRYVEIFNDKTVSVFQDSKALPRAFFVNNIIYSKNSNEFIELSKNIDFSKTAIVEGNNIFSISGRDNNNSKIEWIKNKPIETEIKLNSENPSFLVLLNNYGKGWTAFIDGNKSNIFKTNFTFQGIFIPKGEHSLVIKYSPLSFKAGLVISIISSISLLFLVVLNIVKRNQKKILIILGKNGKN